MFRGSSGGENQGPWVPLVPGCRGSVSGPSKASGLDPSAKARIQRERIINIQPGAHNGPQRLRNSEVCSFPEHNRPIRRMLLLFCPLYRCYSTLMYHNIRRRPHARIVYFFCASSLLPDSANSNPASCPSPLFYFCPFARQVSFFPLPSPPLQILPVFQPTDYPGAHGSLPYLTSDLPRPWPRLKQGESVSVNSGALMPSWSLSKSPGTVSGQIRFFPR